MNAIIYSIQIISEAIELETMLRRIKRDWIAAEKLRVETRAELDSLKAEPVDVFIVDAAQIDAASELLRQIKQNGARSVVLACVEPSRAEKIPTLLASGVYDIVQSPVREWELGARVDTALSLLSARREGGVWRVYLDTIINSVPDLIWFKDLSGAHLKVNDEFAFVSGKSKEEIYGRDELYIWNLSEYLCLESDAKVVNTGKMDIFNENIEGKRGLRQYCVYKSPLIDAGRVIGTCGLARDITELKNKDAKLEIILDNIPFAILVKDNQGVVLNTNRTFEEYFQVKSEQIIGKRFDVMQNLRIVHEEFKPEQKEIEIEIAGEGGNRMILIHVDAILDFFHHKVGEISIYRDVTSERIHEKQIENIAYTDHLTGLYNRRAIYEYMAKQYRPRPAGLLYLDLDHFKKLNDTYGHKSGDEILVFVARLLRDKYPDAFISRIGGDEFVIIFVGACGKAEIEEKAAELVRALKARFETDEKTRMLSASIGVAFFEDGDESIDDLLEKGDAALYRAKKNGKNQYGVY